MKRIIPILLSFLCILSFTACGSNPISGDSDTNQTNPHETSAAPTSASEYPDAEEPDTASGGKILVVFYSATGSTKAVSETIAKSINADVFEIVPQNPYTSSDLDWTNSNSRESVEHNDESKRDVPLKNATPDNWEKYDTVFVGYPIWWGIAAWPINTFISANDFSGKTVIPFCTSSSSGIGNSDKLLAEAADSGNWTEGKRFSSRASEGEITDWVLQLNISQ